jgi:hypothetical protein
MIQDEDKQINKTTYKTKKISNKDLNKIQEMNQGARDW